MAYAVTDSEAKSIALCDAFFELPVSDVSNEDWCDEEDRVLDEFETGGELDTRSLRREVG